MDESHLFGGHAHHPVGGSGFRGKRDGRAASVVVDDLVGDHDGIFVYLEQLESVGGIADDRSLRARLEDVVVRIGPIRRVLDCDDHRVDDGERHDVVVRHLVGILEVRVELGEERLPSVGHSVAVGVPDGRVGAEAVFVGVGESVLVSIGLDLGGPCDGSLQAVGNLVAVDVHVLDVDDEFRGLARKVELVRHRYAARGVDRKPLGADVVGVAPRFGRVALSVVVGVDVRHHEHLSRLDSGERGVDGGDVGLVGELRDVRPELRERLVGEVGRPVRLDDNDSLEVVRVRAEVPHDRAALAVSSRQLRIAVLVPDVHLERSPGAPRLSVGRAVLRVVFRHAPEVVGGIRDDERAVCGNRIVDIERRREGMGKGRRRQIVASRQVLNPRIVDDVRLVRRGRDLQPERRHRIVCARPRERGGRAVDGRGRNGRAGDGNGTLAVERIAERRERDVRDRSAGERRDLGYLVLRRLDVRRRKSELHRVVDEPLPVKVELVVRKDVRLGQVRAVADDVRLRDERAVRDGLVSVQRLAVYADAADDDLRREAALPAFLALSFAAAGGRRRDDSACDALDDRAVARSVGEEVVRDDRGRVPELDHRLGRPVPADVDVADDSVRLAGRVAAVAVEVDPRLDRVEALPDSAGGGIVEPQRLRPFGADRICVLDLDEHSGGGETGVLERGRVKRKLAGEEVDGAENALGLRLRAHDLEVAHAAVVAAQGLAYEVEVETRVVEYDVGASVRPDIGDILVVRARAVPAELGRAVSPRKRALADPRAGGRAPPEILEQRL